MVEQLEIIIKYAGIAGLALFLFYHVVKAILGRIPQSSSNPIYYVIILAFFILVLLCIWKFGPPVQGNTKDIKSISIVLNGRVIDSTNHHPLEGARISIDSYNFDSLTDSNGTFMESLTKSAEPESITIRIHHPGYVAYSQNLQANSRNLDNLTFYLDKKN